MKTKSTDSVDATRNDLESVVEQDDSTVKEEDAELKNGEEKEDDLAGEAYSYTRSGKFTSELYKIEINNLPRYMNFSDLKKLFRNKVKINPIKLKVIRNGSGKAVFAFATFRNETERDEVIKTMNGMTVKNCELRVHAAKPKKDPYIVSKKLLEINSDPM